MSKSTVTKFKWFWADQDLEQEAWLREMARQGLHLQSVNMICRWTFVRSAPADIVYRIDFSDKGKDSAHHRLFEDAGWELAAEVTGWQYWRRQVVDNTAPEIFTDSESKTAKYRRVLAMLAAAIMPPLLMLIVVDKRQMADQLSWPFLLPLLLGYGLILPLYAYSAMRLFKRIRKVHGA